MAPASLSGKSLVEKMAGKKAPATAVAEDPGPRAKPKENAPLAYYDSGKGLYWTLNSRQQWVGFNQSDLKVLLRSKGVSKTPPDGAGISDVEKAVLEIQMTHDVQWAGALAGYPVGHHEVCGSRILVTSGPRIPQPKRGSWSNLKAFFDKLLGKQAPYFYGWLKAGRESLAAGPPFRPGQLLALAGPSGCGKSLLQDIITEIYGGRSAKPYRYLIGQTAFNSDLFGAEHLCIEDEAASTDIRSRREFGANIKNVCVNSTQSLHAKGKEALTVSCFWRLTISTNEEPENLMVLPPLDDSLKDKIFLLRCARADFPFTAEDPRGRQNFRVQLSQEIPAFLYFLKNFVLPEDMKDQRYGVLAFQNSGLTGELAELSPEWKLWNLIEGSNFLPDSPLGWSGTASELERALRLKYSPSEIDGLLRFNTACGVYLERLTRRLPTRVHRERSKDHASIWQILTANHAREPVERTE